MNQYAVAAPKVVVLNEFYPIIENGFGQGKYDTPPGAEGGGTSSTGQAPAGAEGAAAPESGLGGFQPMLMIVLMFVVFYLLLIRPQQKKAKEHQKMLDGVGQGEEIVTNGGLVGRVVGVKGNVLTVEVADKVRVRVLRGQVAGKFSEFSKSDKASDSKSEKK